MKNKGTLHPRNRYQGNYNFAQMQETHPELKNFLKPNYENKVSIDFANPEAVRALNRALLKTWYGVVDWDIPADFLCPPVPGRADYIHNLADILAGLNGGVIPKGPKIRVLDIGVGANCIYPILGHGEYGWSFVGADIEERSLENAAKILAANPGLQSAVELRHQEGRGIFKGMIREDEVFDLTLCNPPFHSSKEETDEINKLKWINLGKAAVANFGGQNNELWCEGGEVAFILQMIEESYEMRNSCFYFSSFVSKGSSLPPIQDELRAAGAGWLVRDMEQGQKHSRFIAWSFLERDALKDWAKRRFQG